MMYYLQPRHLWYTRRFSTLADAVVSGLAGAEPFDVSVASGAIVWAWEMR